MTPELLQKQAQQIYGKQWKKALAKDAGYSQQSISNWLTGKHKIPPTIASHLQLKQMQMNKNFNNYETR